MSTFQRRQKELALLSNEIEDDGHLARARRKQVTNNANRIYQFAIQLISLRQALPSPSTQSVRYLEYNKSRRGGGTKKKQKPYLAAAVVSRPQHPPPLLPPRRNYAVKHPKPSEVRYQCSP